MVCKIKKGTIAGHIGSLNITYKGVNQLTAITTQWEMVIVCIMTDCVTPIMNLKCA